MKKTKKTLLLLLVLLAGILITLSVNAGVVSRTDSEVIVTFNKTSDNDYNETIDKNPTPSDQELYKLEDPNATLLEGEVVEIIAGADNMDGLPLEKLPATGGNYLLPSLLFSSGGLCLVIYWIIGRKSSPKMKSTD